MFIYIFFVIYVDGINVHFSYDFFALFVISCLGISIPFSSARYSVNCRAICSAATDPKVCRFSALLDLYLEPGDFVLFRSLFEMRFSAVVGELLYSPFGDSDRVFFLIGIPFVAGRPLFLLGLTLSFISLFSCIGGVVERGDVTGDVTGDDPAGDTGCGGVGDLIDLPFFRSDLRLSVFRFSSEDSVVFFMWYQSIVRIFVRFI